GATRPADAGRSPRARLDAALRSQRRRRAGLAHGLPRPEAALGPLPARRGADRPRGRLPPLALPDGYVTGQTLLEYLDERHESHGMSIELMDRLVAFYRQAM